VTIAAAPEECVKLSLAESAGKLKLALHSPLDEKAATGTTVMASMSDLRRIAGLKPAPDIKTKMLQPAREYAVRRISRPTATRRSGKARRAWTESPREKSENKERLHNQRD